jgi:PKD repeat protein
MKLWRELVAGILWMFMAQMIFTPFTSAWDAGGGFSPSTAYQGEVTKFTFTFYNDRESNSMDVYWVKVYFGWLSSSTYYYFKANDGTSVSIPAGGSHDFSANLAVSSSLGTYSAEVSVNAKAVGDSVAETIHWTSSTSNAFNVNVVSRLSVSAIASPSSGTTPLTVNFGATASGGSSPYTYYWGFGDGSTSSSANPSHTYSTAGTYTAQVQVSDSGGQTQTDSVTITAQFNVVLTFTKPDGSPLTNTAIYYGTSSGAETSYLGTTDSDGNINSTESSIAGQIIYFKSSDERYSSSTYVSSSSGTVSVTTTEAPISLLPIFSLLLVIVGGVAGGVIMWKKVLHRHKPEKRRTKPTKPAAVRRPPKNDGTIAYIPVMCPACGHPNLPHVKHCAECGHRLQAKPKDQY